MHEAMILRSVGQQISVTNSVTRDYSNLELQRKILRLLRRSSNPPKRAAIDNAITPLYKGDQREFDWYSNVFRHYCHSTSDLSMRSAASICILVNCGLLSLPKPPINGNMTSYSQQQLKDSHEAYTQSHAVASITLMSRKVRKFNQTVYLLLH